MRLRPGSNHFPRGLHDLAGTDFDIYGVHEDEEPDSWWARAPDPEHVRKVDRLLLRIPPRLAVYARMGLEGITTREMGRRMGISQPRAWEHKKSAHAYLAWVVANVPDMTSEEVEQTLLDARGIRRKDATIAARYWRQWNTRTLGYPQGTVYQILFGRGRLVDRLMKRGGEQGEVARGLIAIRDRPRLHPRKVGR